MHRAGWLSSVMMIRSAEAERILAARPGRFLQEAGGGAWIPASRGLGPVRIRHRQRPLRTAADLLDEVAAELGERAGDVRVLDRERLTTDEGELGVLATLAATGAGGPIECAAAFLFGDDFYAQITVLDEEPGSGGAALRLCRALAAGCRLGLSAERRRTYPYQPPPGWTGIRRDGATSWYGPGFPGRHAVIVAEDAMPVGALDAESALADGLGACSFALDLRTESGTPVATAAGLSGEYREVWSAGGGRLLEVVLLGDGRFLYPLRMECDVDALAECRAAFERLVETLQPLPRPVESCRRGICLLEYWT